MFQNDLIMRRYFTKHFSSYRFAVKGISHTLKSQSNIWVMMPAATLVLLLAWYFQVKTNEWLILILIITIVLSLELINTSIESVLNFLYKEHHEDIRVAKDVAAGAVLIAAVASAVIGLMIFWPYL